MVKFPIWVLAHKQKGTEIRLIGGRYYVYAVTSKWIPEKKRSQKITGHLLGKITESGFVPSSKNTLRQSVADSAPMPTSDLSAVHIKEYGLSRFIQQHITDLTDRLQTFFPDQWQSILALAYCRLAFRSPLRKMPMHLAYSYLAVLFPTVAGLQEKEIQQFLHDVGTDRTRIQAFLQSFLDPNQLFVAFTKSTLKNDQVLYMSSANDQIPVYYRLLPGHINLAKAITLTLDACGITQGIFVADQTTHPQNLTSLQEADIKYVLSLRSTHPSVAAAKAQEELLQKSTDYFTYEKRHIWYSFVHLDQNQVLYFFLDEALNAADLHLRADTEPIPNAASDGPFEQSSLFGALCLLTNLKDAQPADVFQYYQTKPISSQMHEHLKGSHDTEKTPNLSDETLHGWHLINHIALLISYNLQQRLSDQNLLSTISTRDLIDHLKEVRAVQVQNAWKSAEVLPATDALLRKLNIAVTN
jgi:hypothetical protein